MARVELNSEWASCDRVKKIGGRNIGGGGGFLLKVAFKARQGNLPAKCFLKRLIRHRAQSVGRSERARVKRFQQQRSFYEYGVEFDIPLLC